jgi:hypothetical protein
MSLPTAPPATHNTYQIIRENAIVTGFGCYDGAVNNVVTIWRPTDITKKYPLLSYSHGYTNGGFDYVNNGIYNVRDYAAAGFIVVLHQSGENLFCWN